jgi:tetratricopeptide (TPR) repeat protein
VQGFVAPSADGTEATTDDEQLPPVGTPRSLARRAAQQFYETAVPPSWPGVGSGADDDAAAQLQQVAQRWSFRDHAGARALLTTYLNVHPDDLQAWEVLAVLCGESNQVADILIVSTQLLQSPDYLGRAYLWRGIANLLLDKTEQSIQDFSLALADANSETWARLFRGVARSQKGDSASSIPDFEAVLGDASTALLAQLGRAGALTTTGKFEMGLDSANAVLDLDPNDADALTIRGDCHGGLTDYEAAATDYQRAMDLVGKTPRLLWRFGTTQWRLQQDAASDTVQTPQSDPEAAAIRPADDRGFHPVKDEWWKSLARGNRRTIDGCKASNRRTSTALASLRIPFSRP